ncbi:uncharacterized protein LOC135369441 [Ornithodoros turicata]|uniref:uncharacterized protein LOC135369441 n=1 Tax=Ornithodoros turicata TaxID=34597 RepID=UPI0031390A7D
MTLTAKIEDGIVYSPYPEMKKPDNISAYEYMEECMQKHGRKNAIIDEKVHLNYPDFLRDMQRYAVGYQSLGVKQGERVCLHVPVTVTAMLAAYGALAAGAVVVLAKTTLTDKELLYILETSRVLFVVTDGKNAQKVRNITSQLSLKLKGLFAVEDSVKGFYSVWNFQNLSETSFKKCVIQDTKTTTAVLTYTSGTTGLPKAANISHYALISSIEVMGVAKAFTKDDTLLTWSPITHISGFIFCFASLCYGTTIVIGKSGMPPADFIRVVNAHKVTSACVFPTAFQKMVSELERLKVKLPSLKKLVISGTVLTAALRERILKEFELHTLQNAFGLSEASGWICVTPPGEIIQGNTVGYPVSSGKCKVVDANTNKKLKANEKGEIMFHGNNMMTSYDGNPEATAAAFDEEGYLRTGDMGYYDDHGRFYVLDRIKDMIKCMDNQIATGEIVNLLLTHSAVEEAAVVGVPHPDYGEAPTAFIVLKANHADPEEVVAEELKKLVKDNLAIYKQLYGGVVFLDALPKTDSGKYRCVELRKMLIP